MNSNNALYVIATPIGNLADMVPRAVEILQKVAWIAAEDTRHSAKLLQHYQINTPVVAYHDHSGKQRLEWVIEQLQQGKDVALICDAGTPVIADPGYRIVKAAREASIRVIPIPGACALTSALSVSGLPSDRFAFEGFLPSKASQRKKYLESLVNEPRTLIFYESPRRLVDSLQDFLEVFGAQRRAVIARELTKAFETILDGSLSDLLTIVTEDIQQQRGEIVLLLEGQRETPEMDDETQRIMAILLEELPLRQAAALGAKITQVGRKQLYQWALKQRGEEN